MTPWWFVRAEGIVDGSLERGLARLARARIVRFLHTIRTECLNDYGRL